MLFGPTSWAEIELYGLGEKVVPEMECLSCYKTSCDFVPNCMDLIPPTWSRAPSAVNSRSSLAGPRSRLR